jgi:hypothetical protein
VSAEQRERHHAVPRCLLRLREAAHATAEAALVEARRRVRVEEEGR